MMQTARTLISLVAIVTAGCSTPGDVRRDGIQKEYVLQLPPARAARCLTRNAEEYSVIFVPRLQDTDVPNVYEVIVRTDLTAVAVARVGPRGSGSVATIWRSALPLMAIGLPDAMAKGC